MQARCIESTHTVVTLARTPILTCKVTLARMVRNSVISACMFSRLYSEPMKHKVSSTTLGSPFKKWQRSSSNNKPYVQHQEARLSLRDLRVPCSQSYMHVSPTLAASVRGLTLAIKKQISLTVLRILLISTSTRMAYDIFTGPRLIDSSHKTWACDEVGTHVQGGLSLASFRPQPPQCPATKANARRRGEEASSFLEWVANGISSAHCCTI